MQDTCDHCGEEFPPQAVRVDGLCPRPSSPDTLAVVLSFCGACALQLGWTDSPLSAHAVPGMATGKQLNDWFESGAAAANGIAFVG